MAEELSRKFPKVEPITMTAPVKESLASRILTTFQRGEVTIPNHRPLIDDPHSIQRSVTLSGNLRYGAPREAGSHAERKTPAERLLPYPRKLGEPLTRVINRLG